MRKTGPLTWQATALFAAAATCLASPTRNKSLYGCQGAPSSPVRIAKPTLILVWPCFAQADAVPEAPDDPERALDHKMSDQYMRLREEVTAAGVQLLKASGALHLDFMNPDGKTEKVRTNTVEWRGLLMFCPGRKVDMKEGTFSDGELLDILRACVQPADPDGRYPCRI